MDNYFFIIFAVIGVLIVVFTTNKERISTDENRVLQNAPGFTIAGFLKGDFASEFENFLSDSIPARSPIIGVSDNILNRLSFNTSEDMYYLDTTSKEVAEYQGDDQEKSETEEKTDTGDSGASEGEPSDGDAVFELVKRDGGSTLIYTYPKKNLEQVAKNLDNFADYIPDDGHIYITLVPFPGLGRRFSNNLKVYSGWRSNKLDEIDKLTSDKIVCFDSLKILEPHILDGEDLFLYGNHQWTIRGSYYAFCEMIKAQGLTPTPYEEYEYKVNRPDNPAYTNLDTYELLYPLAPAVNYRVEHIDKREKIPFMAYDAAATSAYLYGNVHPWKTVITGFHTGRNALVIGDCFDLSMTPFLLPYYDEVHKTDIRYRIFDRQLLGTSVVDMMQRNSIDDVYLIFSEANDINSATLLNALADNII